MSPTKTTHARIARTKVSMKAKARPVEASAESAEVEILETPTLVPKRVIEIEIPEEVPAAVEEKTDDESAASEEGAEDGTGEELTLDDDELNPFGDKWEQ